ncbi:hypothetical protein DFH09DRAFT_1109717 [Mycena vulgaris]|nr:hypothetical protein DFH09DRAFT_1109717 [Mycena vulgaris]
MPAMFLGLIPLIVLNLMTKEVLSRHFWNVVLVHAVLVGGRVVLATVLGAVALYLSDARTTLHAANNAKSAQDTEAEQTAIEYWMLSMERANHAMCCGYPPVLSDISTAGISPDLAIPNASIFAAVGWWKDYVRMISGRYEMAATHLLEVGFETTVLLDILANKIEVARSERNTVAAQVITATAFDIALARVVRLHTTLLPTASARSFRVRHTLGMVLEDVHDAVTSVTEIHMVSSLERVAVEKNVSGEQSETPEVSSLIRFNTFPLDAGQETEHVNPPSRRFRGGFNVIKSWSYSGGVAWYILAVVDDLLCKAFEDDEVQALKEELQVWEESRVP